MFRLLLGVVGLTGIVIALPLLFAGGSLVWMDATKTDANGFLNSATMDIEVDGFALVAGPAEIEDLPDMPAGPVSLGKVASLRIQAENMDPGKGTFIGVAPTDSLDTYLGGVTYAVVEDSAPDAMFLSYRTNATGEPLAPPAEQTFWTASAAGEGPQELQWDLQEGTISFVIMNDDASDGIAVEAIVGARIPLLRPVGTALVLGGAAALTLGGLFLAIAL
jgi:hypothetical protein